MKLTVPCLFGLEALVAEEMRRLQLQEVQAENGRAESESALRRPGAHGAGLLPGAGL